MSDGQGKKFENSEAEVIETPTNGSKPAAAEEKAAPASHARRGTGPRTRLGKERSKRNAIKHGILSELAVLKNESRAEYDSKLWGFRDYYRPVGMMEKELVMTIANAKWHSQRGIRALNAETEASSELFLEWDEQHRQLQEAGRLSSVSSHGGLIRKIENSEVLETCLSRLRVLKIGIETNGFNRDKDRSILTQLYGQLNEDHWQNDIFWAYHVWAGTASLPDAMRTQQKFPSPKECVDHFLSELRQEIARLHVYGVTRAEVEHRRREVELRRRSVPDTPRLDRLLRHLAYWDRVADRATRELERLQRMRLGQPVAPRIDVNVSSS